MSYVKIQIGSICSFIFTVALVYYGNLRVLLMVYMLKTAINEFMKYFYGLKNLSVLDNYYISTLPNRNTLIKYLVFEDEGFNLNELKQHLVKTAFSSISKLRSKIVYKHFSLWWKEHSISDAVENCIETRKGSFSELSEFNNYLHDELRSGFALLDNYQFKFIILQNEKNLTGLKNILIFKYDHILTDGMGAVSILATISDNFDKDMLSPYMEKKYSVSEYFYTLITSPLILYNYINSLLSLRTKIKENPLRFKDDANSSPLKFEISTSYDFNKFYNKAKTAKVTFNTLISACVSAAMNKYYSSIGIEMPKTLISGLAIGNKKLPEDLNNVDMRNNSININVEFKLIDNVVSELETVSKNFSSNLRNNHFMIFNRVLYDIVLGILPFSLAQKILSLMEYGDLDISNFHGPRKCLIYSGMKVTDFSFCEVNCGNYNLKVFIYTYNNNFKFTLINRDKTAINTNIFLKFIDEEITKILK